MYFIFHLKLAIMPSATARLCIKASVPVRRAHGLTLPRYFYARMLASRAALTNRFKLGNQAIGNPRGFCSAGASALINQPLRGLRLRLAIRNLRMAFFI